jgi:hypothetical protein
MEDESICVEDPIQVTGCVHIVSKRSLKNAVLTRSPKVDTG